MTNEIHCALIAAISLNGVIGVSGQLPWHLPADLKHFRKLTTGHAVIMGRNTYHSIGKALPNRLNIVLSRNLNFKAGDCVVASTLEEALRLGSSMPAPIFVIGGAEVFQESLYKGFIDRLYLTMVDCSIIGDTFFPKLDPNEWKIVASKEYSQDNNNAYSMQFQTLDKV